MPLRSYNLCTVSMRLSLDSSADRAAGPRERPGSIGHEHTTSPARCEIARDEPAASQGQTCSADRLAATYYSTYVVLTYYTYRPLCIGMGERMLCCCQKEPRGSQRARSTKAQTLGKICGLCHIRNVNAVFRPTEGFCF